MSDELRLTAEHALLPGVFLKQPRRFLHIYDDGKEIGVFGFHVMSRKEVEDAIMLRATQLLECSMVDPMLHSVTAKVRYGELEAWFEYNSENFYFEEK